MGPAGWGAGQPHTWKEKSFPAIKPGLLGMLAQRQCSKLHFWDAHSPLGQAEAAAPPLCSEVG